MGRATIAQAAPPPRVVPLSSIPMMGAFRVANHPHISPSGVWVRVHDVQEDMGAFIDLTSGGLFRAKPGSSLYDIDVIPLDVHITWKDA
jgi:hypothetical protein